ncbi:hypothetical protein GCM10008986_25430 [Salinibacillus aidingensis]|uniref:NERD domain-containing protein n=1 Tax=Salinibacillus aidingensis TaxID=237684 RepID=A0ABN1BGG1_9BACI
MGDFSDPLQQVKHQKYQFERWLEDIKVSGIPVEHLVVMANPKSILKTTNPKSEYVNRVLHSTHLLEKINEMQAAYPKDVLTLKQIRSLSKRLIKSNVPEDPDILNLFEVAKTDLITGVQCPNCENAPMKRKSGKWICPHCKISSKDAHAQALQDYALLMDKTINNQEARKFLQVESPSVAYNLLQSTGATQSGKNRTRVYHLIS